MSTETEPRRLGRYELQERLGRGGMAEVWKALDTQLQRHVAIKVLHADLRTDPNFTSRFEREAQLIAVLHHPNIVQIYDFQISFANNTTGGSGADADEPAAYMIMDYVEGQTLAQYLHKTAQQGKFLSYTELLHLFTPICRAIEYAHKKGMVHRDLKPANILLDERNKVNNSAGEPIISDFGISKMLNDQTQTQHGFWLGTPAYIAPEQVQGERTNERSDIYALAIILYETCTGTLPFQADGPIALAMQHVQGNPTPPNLINPLISQELADVIMQGMEKDPSKRFPTAAALLNALTKALGGTLPEKITASGEYAIASDEYATAASDEYATRAADNNVDSINHSKGSDVDTDAPTLLGSSDISAAIPDMATVIATPDMSAAIPDMATVIATPDMGTASSDAANDGATPDMSAASSDADNDDATPDMETVVASASIPTVVSTSASPFVATPPARRPKQNKKLLPILIACLLVAAIAFGAFLVLPRFTAIGQSGTGTLNFLNSGQYNPQGTAGITDEAQIDFTALPPPDAGKAYYAWLLSDAKSPNQQSMFLGKLPVNDGKAQLMFNGDADHSNILARYSRFVLTLENASALPKQPGAKSTWRYYGEIPNIPIPSDIISHYSLLDHMRHLTSEDPIIGALNLHGGLNLWFGRNTQKLLESASSARDEMNPDLVHRQIIRSLDYLDGSTYSKVDVPAGTPFLIDPVAGQVGLMTFSPEQPVPGLVSHISKHLQGLSQAPGALDEQVKLANQLAGETQIVEKALGQARLDAKQLVAMDDTQLTKPAAHTLLNDLVLQINTAYVGQRDPATGELRGGVEQISAQILHLSMISIKPYAQK